jgi:hypothetical protein
MSLHNFFQSLFPSKRSTPRSARRAARRARLGLEALEGRTLLSSAQLVLSGPQTLVANNNIFVSHDARGVLSDKTQESEMQISINPTNPFNVVGFTHNLSNANEIQLFFSLDGGKSWTRRVITNRNGDNPNGGFDINDGQGFANRSDPSVAFDANGNLFISYGLDHGGNPGFDTLIVGRSGDGGDTFSNFYVVATAATAAANGMDQPRLATGLDPVSGRQAVYIAYDFSHSAGTHLNDSSQIFVSGFRFGVDRGFSTPVSIAQETGQNASFTLNAAEPAVGPNGELYVSWRDTIHDFGTSRDRADIFVRRKLTGLFGVGSFESQVHVRSLNFDSISNPSDAFTVHPPAQRRRGFGPFPSIVVDRSGGPFNGRVYIAYTEHIGQDTTNILLSTSTDRGATWTPQNQATFIEGSLGTSFAAAPVVDQNTGALSVAYYTTDGVAGLDKDKVELRVATSTDGGRTFTKTNVSSLPSRAESVASDNELLEYIGLDARNGTLQAFWADNRSDNDGSFDFHVHGYTASISTHNSANQLRISGDGQIILRTDFTNPAFADVLINDQLVWSGLWASVGNVLITTGNANDDTVFIDNTVAGTPVVVDLGAGHARVNIFPIGGNLDDIQGDVSLHGGGGTATLNIDDSGNPVATSWTLADGLDHHVIRTGSAAISYGLVAASVIITAGTNANNNYLVTGTNLFTTTTLNVGHGNDTVTVRANSGPLTINGSGNDTVNVGNRGSLAGIFGPLSINNGNSAAQVNISDVTDSTNHDNVTLTDHSLTGLAADINFGPNSLAGLRITTGTGQTTITVGNTPASAAAGAQTVLDVASGFTIVNVLGTAGSDPLSIQAAGQHNINGLVHIGNSGFSGGGTLTGIHGAVSVFGSRLLIDDSADRTDHPNVVLTDTSLTGLAAPITFDSLTDLSISGGNGTNQYEVDNSPLSLARTPTQLVTGGGSDTVNVLGTSGSLSITGQNPNDVMNVGNNGSLAGLLGTLTLDSDSFSRVTIDDRNDGNNHQNVTLTATSLTNLVPVPINFVPFTLTRLTITGGNGNNGWTIANTPPMRPSGNPIILTTGGGTNRVTVLATDPSAPLTVQSGSGVTGVQVGNGLVSGIQSPLTLNNAASGLLNLSIDDRADTNNHPDVQLTDTSLIGLTNPAAPITFVANPLTGRRLNALFITGGSGTNTYTVAHTTAFSGSFASFAGLITGSGSDTVTVQGTGANEFLTVEDEVLNGTSFTVLATAVMKVGKDHKLTGILGTLTVFGGQVTIDDAADNTDHPDVQLSNLNGLTGLTRNPIFLHALSGPTITVGNGKNKYTIANTAFTFGTFTPPVRPMILNTGNGDDTVNILGTDSVSPLTVEAGGHGNDVINVGNNHSLAGIKGALTLNNRPRFSPVNIDGGADTDNHPNVQLAANSLTGLTADIFFGPNSLKGLTITGGSGNNKYTILDTIFSGVTGGDPTLLNTGNGNDTVSVQRTDKTAPLTIQAGTGTDTINIGTVTNTLDLLDGTVTVHGGPGVTTLNINDQGSITPHTYNQTLTTLDRSGAARITFTGIANLHINKGPVLGPMLTDLSFPQSIRAGQLATLKGRLVDPDPRARLTLRVTWGDGSRPETIRPGQNPFTLQHRYGKAGKYTVHLVWFDAQGHANSEELSLDVT